MLQMKVSVIIPVFNSERYLRQCLDSVLCQSMQDFEIICVDDGSTDGSKSIIEEYSQMDPRIILVSQGNRGGGAARNTGMEIARGEYLYFLDADDWIESDLLQSAVGECERRGADLVVFPALTFDVRTGEEQETKWVFRRDLIPEARPLSYRVFPDGIFAAFGNVPWNKVFRHSFVRHHGLHFQELFRTNDLYFSCCSLILANSIAILDRPLVHYRTGTGQNSQATNSREPLGFYRAFCALKHFLEEEGVYEVVEKGFLNHALDGLVSNLSSLRSHESFSRVLSVFKNEMDEKFGFSKYPSDYYVDPIKYELYSALHESSLEDGVFAWGRVMQRQRDREWICTAALSSERKKLKEENELLLRSLDEVQQSTSYRIGRAITKPFRLVKNASC